MKLLLRIWHLLTDHGPLAEIVENEHGEWRCKRCGGKVDL